MKKLYVFIVALLLIVPIYAKKSIEIDLSNQRIYAKENGKIVFRGNVSTGKKDHPTPRGKFRVIEKDRFHISNKYPEPDGGAEMPYMLRLTNSGIAIHQGYLPGYPASHGCIRVSKATAKKLWRWSRIGTSVKIYGSASDFRYAKKSKKKKRYAKKVDRKKRYSKKKVYKKKRRYAKKRKRPIRQHYVKRDDDGYEIIELYDSW